MAKYEHGLGMLFEPCISKPEEEPTTQCVHCGGHFPLPTFGNSAKARKNRIGRGFCQNCGGFICGERCLECVPFHRWLEIVEGRINPTSVSNTKRNWGAIDVSASPAWLPSTT